MSPDSPRPRVLVAQPVHADVVARLAEVAEVDVHPGPDPLPTPVLAERLRGAQALMGFMTERVDAALLQAAPGLRIVAGALKGFDNYDATACTAAGVWLSIVPDLLTAPTAELAVGLAIGLGRHLREGDTLVRVGGFHGWRARLYGRGLDGSTVAVVGLGALGRAVVERLRGFGCTIVGVDPHAAAPAGVRPMALDDALRIADHVILALPLTAQTRHLIGAARLAAARPGVLWVNVGRGSVVDEAAMAEHLAHDHDSGYAADVFAFEDWADAGRPRHIPAALRARANTLFTPHLGSAVATVRRAIEHRAADNILAVLAGGRPPDAVNAPRPAPAQSASKAAAGTRARSSPSTSPSSAR